MAGITARPPRHGGHHREAAAVRHRGNHRGTVVHDLLAVHDPAEVTGTLTGHCRTRDHGLLPDPSRKPGAIDPAVTQANIGSTICRAGYTDSVRPPESQTEAFKWHVAEPAYGQHDVSGELDHLVPLGGDNDTLNLWVEAGRYRTRKTPSRTRSTTPYAMARSRCAPPSKRSPGTGSNPPPPLASPIPGPARSPSAGRPAWCTATAAYTSRYADWDVYVHSNQPDATVTASSSGYSHSWHTNADGYADVYLRGPSPGHTMHVTAGAASCSTTAG
jgi:hypothetical protein